MDGVYILSQSYDLVLIPSYKRWYFYLEDNISGVVFKEAKLQQNLLYEERLDQRSTSPPLPLKPWSQQYPRDQSERKEAFFLTSWRTYVFP